VGCEREDSSALSQNEPAYSRFWHKADIGAVPNDVRVFWASLRFGLGQTTPGWMMVS
jgi:hypothetical protein